jgi:hypothetical protein
LVFRSGFREVVSTFAQKREEAEAGLADTVGQLDALAVEMGAATQAATRPGEERAAAKAALTDLEEKKARLVAQVARYKEALAGYNELERFSVTVQLGNTRAASIPFEHAAPATSTTPATTPAEGTQGGGPG